MSFLESGYNQPVYSVDRPCVSIICMNEFFLTLLTALSGIALVGIPLLVILYFVKGASRSVMTPRERTALIISAAAPFLFAAQISLLTLLPQLLFLIFEVVFIVAVFISYLFGIKAATSLFLSARRLSVFDTIALFIICFEVYLFLYIAWWLWTSYHVY